MLLWANLNCSPSCDNYFDMNHWSDCQPTFFSPHSPISLSLSLSLSDTHTPSTVQSPPHTPTHPHTHTHTHTRSHEHKNSIFGDTNSNFLCCWFVRPGLLAIWWVNWVVFIAAAAAALQDCISWDTNQQRLPTSSSSSSSTTSSAAAGFSSHWIES